MVLKYLLNIEWFESEVSETVREPSKLKSLIEVQVEEMCLDSL